MRAFLAVALGAALGLAACADEAAEPGSQGGGLFWRAAG